MFKYKLLSRSCVQANQQVIVQPIKRLQTLRASLLHLVGVYHCRRHIQYSSFAAVEDAYSLSTDWDLYSKWKTIQDNLARAASGPSTTTYLTYLSASGGAAPFFVVSGKTLSGTHGNQLLVSAAPFRCSNKIYADFFNTKCVLRFKYISFKGTNMLVNDFLSTRKQRVGIVMTDFPGGDLLSKIIAMNF